MKKIKYFTVMAAALLLGFSSCSNDENAPRVDDSPKNVTVRISKPSTYAGNNEEESAARKTPDLNDVRVFFIGSGVIKYIGEIDETDLLAKEKTFTGVSGLADKVVIIANAKELSSPENIASILKDDPESKLNKLMFEQVKQTNPVSAVNLYGTAPITGNAGDEVAEVMLEPAISRIEIAEVKVIPTNDAVIPLTEFKLAGIYINNTYKKCGTDYETLPTVLSGDILNYEGTNEIFTKTPNTYPSSFCTVWSEPIVAKTVFTPENENFRWAYNVLPVKKDNGTTINGGIQSSVPHIILKITDATADDDENYVIPKTTYVTIKELQVEGTGGVLETLTALKKGKVYSIASIEIGGEHLASTPGTPAKQDVKVTVSVTDWEEQPVTPKFP